MKNILNKLLMNSPKIRNSVYRALYLLDKTQGKQSSLFVLCYHGIGRDTWRYSVPFSLLKKQIQYLKSKGYQFIKLSDLLAHLLNGKQLPEKAVVITIDDGYKELGNTCEYFKSENIYPAVFLLADTQHPNRHELANTKKFLSATDIHLLKSYGWEFGSHSATHSNLTILSEHELKKEIIDSKTFLETKTKTRIEFFAYPRGKYTPQVLAMTKKAGYKLGLTMDDGIISKKTDRLQIPRIGIDRTHTMQEFPMLFSPSVIETRKRIKESFLGRYI